MKHIKKFEKYEFEDFTAVDMDLVKDLYEDGMTDPKEIHRELDFRDLSIDQVEQIIYSLKKSGQINENNITDSYYKISVDEYNDIMVFQPLRNRFSRGIFFENTEIQAVKSIVPESVRNLFKKDVISLNYFGVQMSINKFDDEWFLVMFTKRVESPVYKHNYIFEYYKCDQSKYIIS